ncbi:lamin tail domain-containing protein [Luteolibacter sp. Populi]|uniref:lamin tail domain-containing protein n=1 Tax=Luteolibacter sp. Populi TaxID=3230487 RepID=UPI0034651DD6
MTEATFLLDTDPASPANLAISEIHYHPLDPSEDEEAAGFNESDDFEFVELLNTGTRHIDLTGVYFYGAINYEFNGAATGRTLAPGARVLVVARRDAFEMRYGPGKPVAGEFSGHLDNAGEDLVLYTPGDAEIRGVNYGEAPPWPVAADGEGNSLVRRHPNDPAGDDNGDGWAPSADVGGSPGEADVPSAGSFGAWAAASFTPLQSGDAGVSAISADPDGDGRVNFEEFAFATDPMVADQVFTEFVWLGAGPVKTPALRLRCPQFAQSIRYELLASDELAGGWEAVATFPELSDDLGGGFQLATFSDVGPGTGKRFLRMRATWVP